MKRLVLFSLIVSAAAVAQVVMMWLLARPTDLLRTLISTLSTHWSGRLFRRDK